MPKVSPGFTNFTRGVISPLTTGRVDYQGYFDGATVLENFIVDVRGPLIRRPGTYYTATAKGGTSTVVLIPFEFSTEQAYVLEFGDKYMRVYRDRGQVMSPGGTTVYEIETPYAGVSLSEIKYAQSADTIYLVHPDYRPQKLTRSGHTVWTIAGVSTTHGPAMDVVDNATTLTAVGVGAGTTTSITAGTTVFYPQHEGSVWRWDMTTGTSGYFTVLDYISGTSIIALIGGVSLAAYSTAIWGEAAWSDYKGWPHAVKFHENRLFYAGTDYLPTTLWGSMIGNYDNFWTGAFADDGLALTTQNLNAIRWLESTNNLIVGTTGGVLKISGPSTDDPIAYDAVCKTQTSKGCADIMPNIVGESILYVNRSGRKVHELAYSLERDGYVAPNRTVVAEHITKSGVSCTAYQSEPDSILWAGLKNGNYTSFTYEPDEKVLAWASQITQGVVESMCVVPGVEEDELWMSVIRNIGGVSMHMIEYMMPRQFNTIYDAFFVDCGLSRNNAGTTTQDLTGLDHLAGCTVDILVDGTAHPQRLVNALGGVSLQYAGTTIHAGLPYQSKYRSVNLVGGSRMGTDVGKIKRIINVILRVYNTVGGKIGFDDNRLNDIAWRDGTSHYDAPTAMFSGDKKMGFTHGYDTEAYVEVVQDKPLPMTILNVIPTFDTRDK